MVSHRKAVRSRSKRRKFLKKVIEKYNNQLSLVGSSSGAEKEDLERKKSYYEKQLSRL